MSKLRFTPRFLRQPSPLPGGRTIAAMRMLPTRCAILISASLFLVLLLPALVAAATLRIGSGSSVQSVQDALKNAQPGDTIIVGPGIYQGALLLAVPVILRGEGAPILRGSGTGSTVTISADNCTVDGFIIEHSGGDLRAEDSGILVMSRHNTIEHNVLRDVLYGIYLYNSSDNLILQNDITGRRELEPGERGAGLHLWNSFNNTLDGNRVAFARDGMYIQSSSGNIVRNNRVSQLRYGLHYMNSDNNTFEDNLFSENVAGAAIMYSRHIQLRRNSFIQNRGYSSFGILFQDCDDCLVEDNFVIGNSCGLFLEALRMGKFTHNVISDNDVAMQIFSSVDGCEFSANNFVDNLSPLQLVGATTSTKWKGNYWSDYEGYDLNGDGVGDIGRRVQNVFSFLEGNFPRLRLYLSSPAAQALANAEKAFPVVRGSGLYDPAPLVRPMTFSYPFEMKPHPLSERAMMGVFSAAFASLGLVVLFRRRQPWSK